MADIFNHPPGQEIKAVTSVFSAPIIYADALIHATWINGVVKLAFVANNADLKAEDGTGGIFEAHHVVTIAMPIGQVAAATEYLQGLVVEWTKDATSTPAT